MLIAPLIKKCLNATFLSPPLFLQSTTSLLKHKFSNQIYQTSSYIMLKAALHVGLMPNLLQLSCQISILHHKNISHQMSKLTAFIPSVNWLNRQEKSTRSLNISNIILHAFESSCKYPHHSCDEVRCSKTSLIAYLANMVKFNSKLLISMLELRKKPVNFVSSLILL